MYKYILIILLLAALAGCRDSREAAEYRVAILTPVSHPSLVEVEKAFKERLEDLSISFTTYNAQGNRALMRGEAEEIVKKRYDLVLAIGAQATLMVKEAEAKSNADIPIVFATITHPENLDLASPMITGAVEVSDYPRLFREIADLEMRKAAIVYNPSQYMMAENAREVESILENRGVKVKKVEVFQANEILAKTSSALADCDAIVVLKDNTVVSALDVLVKRAKKHNIPLIASDLNSFDRGADIAFGVREADYGIRSAEIARKILIERQSPGDISYIEVDTFELLRRER